MTVKTHTRANPADTIVDDGDFESQTVVFDGEECELRMLRPDDASRVQRFFYTHTRETIQMRYGHAVARMTDQRAMELVSVNQRRDVALAILAKVAGRQVIHAIGRYYLDPDGNSAEVAFVVRESKRRLGMGSLLLRTLMDIARRRGLNSLWGRVRPDNLPMLTLFRQFGGLPVPENEECDGDVDVHVPLLPAPKSGRKPSKKRKMSANRRRRN